MANQAYKKEELELQDGTVVEIRDLPIAKLKRFKAQWEKIADVNTEDDDETMEVFINCCAVALEANFEDLFETLYANTKTKFLTTEYKDHLENVLDIPTIYRILDVCGGIKLDDPKLLEMVQQATKELDGTN